MTQDVQPLTWQKRTNLEEHQQFFSKINEIIDNLAPTVDEAEAAIAQATAAIASANDAIATANAASAAASAAASQAQTAASTVAGYDTRLTAAEGDIDDLQAADQTMAGDISALGTRMTAAESKNSQQDTAIGALQTADAQNVKISRINEYAVGLTGNQLNIAGNKGFTGTVTANFYRTSGADGYRRINIDRSDDELAVAPAASVLYPLIAWNDKDNNLMSAIYVSHLPNGTTSISVQTRNSDGTIKYTTIAQGDVI